MAKNTDSVAVEGLSPKSGLRAWLELAGHPATVRRALMTVLIVGVVLIAINHGPAIVAGEITKARLFQMALTLLVPYTVSTVSSVATRREMLRKQEKSER